MLSSGCNTHLKSQLAIKLFGHFYYYLSHCYYMLSVRNFELQPGKIFHTIRTYEFAAGNTRILDFQIVPFLFYNRKMFHWSCDSLVGTMFWLITTVCVLTVPILDNYLEKKQKKVVEEIRSYKSRKIWIPHVRSHALWMKLWKDELKKYMECPVTISYQIIFSIFWSHDIWFVLLTSLFSPIS